MNRNAVYTLPPLPLAFWGAGSGRRDSRERHRSAIGGLQRGHRPVEHTWGFLKGCSASPRSAQRGSCVCFGCRTMPVRVTSSPSSAAKVCLRGQRGWDFSSSPRAPLCEAPETLLLEFHGE